VKRRLVALAFVAAAVAAAPVVPSRAAGPVKYRFSFPAPADRWMQVDATFAELPTAPLELRMSRSSPGRYGQHDFAKEVYDVRAYAPDGRELRTERPDDSGWRVPAHGGSVTLKYKVRGDRLDGTYLAIDSSHAHINMPAAIMWGRGLDDRPAALTFDPPDGAPWQVATQLFGDWPPHDPGRPVPDVYEFTAPNLQYLMDSPVELGPLTVETFSVGARTFRLAVHHTGTANEVQAVVGDVAKIVQQQGAIYGEFPPFETGAYTFLVDYLPQANFDAMEHRNSTVITAPGSISRSRVDLLDSVAHEFFHTWNVERIRPRSLEPFDLDRTNASSELWLAEGFTQYYGPLVLQRAGIVDLRYTAGVFTSLLDTIGAARGRLTRSAEEISRMAVVTDGGGADRSSGIGDVSYYHLGAAIALSLDLSLRQRSNGRLSLDDFMQEMWRRYGKPGGARQGYVDRPYTMEDAEATLAAITDTRFARDFFDRYIEGRELADYGQLLAPAGFLARHAPRGNLEIVAIEAAGGTLTAAQRTFRDSWLGAK
jgi:predicted metalloprotease with PDZ domain